MSRSDISLPQRRFGQTSRRDGWWIQPLLTFLGLGGFIVYATWRAAMNADFIHGSLLSPFYSPYLIGDSDHAWFRVAVDWKRYWPVTPALLILIFPGGFRFTCYYYRGAYYKAFWADPPACAVGEPRKGYRGENIVPAHPPERAPLLPVSRAGVHLLSGILGCSTSRALCSEVHADGTMAFGLGVGPIVLTLMNVVFLGGYTFGCHSLRHLVGGESSTLLAGGRCVRKAYDCVSCLNRRHMRWAWISLFWVGFSDVYVRLCSMGLRHLERQDWKII